MIRVEWADDTHTNIRAAARILGINETQIAALRQSDPLKVTVFWNDGTAEGEITKSVLAYVAVDDEWVVMDD